MNQKALVLIDFQKEWMNPTSDYFVGDISAVIRKVNELIDKCRSLGYKIIFTLHEEVGSTTAFVPNSDNASLIDELHNAENDVVIIKNKISPFYKTNLEEELKGIGEVVVCGLLTNLCVRSFIQDAYDRDFQITVVTDCCVARTSETQEFTLQDLKEERVEIIFLTHEEFMKASLERS